MRIDSAVRPAVRLAAAAALSLGVLLAWTPAAEAAEAATQPAKAPTTRPAATAPAEPCPTGEPCPTPATTQPGKNGKIQQFAADSPFTGEYKPPKQVNGKRIWAYSCLWEKAPKLEVEKWLSKDQPKTEGKFVLIEFWATWCPPCRKSIELLNALHKKFGKDLVVIGTSDETEAAVRALKDHKIEYFSAIDTQARTKKKLGVYGIPHVIVIEPEGHVVWEGFPLLKDHELTEKIVAKMIDIGRKSGSLK